MSSNETQKILIADLTKYIQIINEDVDPNELNEYDLYSLVSLYCQTYSIPLECFYGCLANIVRQYKINNPDDVMTDEEIYVLTDAFEPLNHFEEATLYIKQVSASLAGQVSEANDKFFACLEDVRIEQERLEDAKTSLEKSEIRSELAQANIALDKARITESNLINREKNIANLQDDLQKKIKIYYSKMNCNKDDESPIKLSRTNPVKPE